MPREGRSGSPSRRSGPSGGGSWGNGRSMGTSPAPRRKAPPASSSLPAKQPPAKQPPAKQAPASGGKQPPAGQGAGVAGMFGASMAGSLAGTMLGAALLARSGSEGARPGADGSWSAEPHMSGKCASEFVTLLKCVENGNLDLDRCNAELDGLSDCHAQRE